jgi:hypothetical protein
MQQILLVLGSMILLSLLTISVNNLIINHTIETYESESIIAKTSLAQAMLQEISLKEFDDKTIGATVDTASSLTPVAQLGKEAGETYSTFDDMDDYKDFTRLDTLVNGVFRSTVDVYYVTQSNLTTASVSPTFYKMISVTVNDLNNSSTPMTLSNIISY